MSNSNIIIYGTKWCWDCTRARRYFDSNDIEYEWINIDDDPLAEQFVKENNQGMRSVPTILFPDGSILVEPSRAQLEQKMRAIS